MYSGYDLITMAPGEVKIEAMPPPHKAGRVEDPLIYLAAERAFLAWVRTLLALMGFGFLIARFGLLLRETEASIGARGGSAGCYDVLPGMSIQMAGPLPHVVILGAGFGGLNAALALKRAPVRITVIDRANHHLFQPLLYQVATAALSPADISAPIRRILRRQKNVEACSPRPLRSTCRRDGSSLPMGRSTMTSSSWPPGPLTPTSGTKTGVAGPRPEDPQGRPPDTPARPHCVRDRRRRARQEASTRVDDLRDRGAGPPESNLRARWRKWLARPWHVTSATSTRRSARCPG